MSLKQFITDNKIYFDFFTTVILGVMGLIISIIAVKFNRISAKYEEKQFELDRTLKLPYFIATIDEDKNTYELLNIGKFANDIGIAMFPILDIASNTNEHTNSNTIYYSLSLPSHAYNIALEKEIYDKIHYFYSKEGTENLYYINDNKIIINDYIKKTHKDALEFINLNKELKFNPIVKYYHLVIINYLDYNYEFTYNFYHLSHGSLFKINYKEFKKRLSSYSFGINMESKLTKYNNYLKNNLNKN